MLITKTIESEIENLSLTEIVNETILLYFASINSENFSNIQSLFAENSELYPPFESPIVGRENIANFLEKEARGLRLIPKECKQEQREYQVTGTVQTQLFSVNVQWIFLINDEGYIQLVKIKLLATLEKLLGLKDAKNKHSKASSD